MIFGNRQSPVELGGEAGAVPILPLWEKA